MISITHMENQTSLLWEQPDWKQQGNEWILRETGGLVTELELRLV